MKPEEARKLFEPALRDELSNGERAAFEAALADAQLAAEFEGYADAQGDLTGINTWLCDAARAANAIDGGTYAGTAARVIQQAQATRRGRRLIRLGVAIGTAAAAAAIVAVIFIQPDQSSNNGTAATLAGEGNEEKSTENHEEPPKKGPEAAKSFEEDKKELLEKWKLDGVAKIRQPVRRDDGTALPEWAYEAWFEGHDKPLGVGNSLPGTGFTIDKVVFESEPPEDRKAEVHVKHHSGGIVVIRFEGKPVPHSQLFLRLDLNADLKLTADEVPRFMIDDWDDDKSGDLSADEFGKHHKPPMVKPEDEFKRLDTNADGKLDEVEAPRPMLRDFDDDADGEITLDEFRKHFKPRPLPPEEEFKRLDRTADGALDKEEVPVRMIRDLDADADNRITLDEFKAKPHPEGPPERQRPPRGEGPPQGDRPPPRREGPPPRRDDPPPKE